MKGEKEVHTHLPSGEDNRWLFNTLPKDNVKKTLR